LPLLSDETHVRAPQNSTPARPFPPPPFETGPHQQNERRKGKLVRSPRIQLSNYNAFPKKKRAANPAACFVGLENHRQNVSDPYSVGAKCRASLSPPRPKELVLPECYVRVCQFALETVPWGASLAPAQKFHSPTRQLKQVMRATQWSQRGCPPFGLFVTNHGVNGLLHEKVLRPVEKNLMPP